MKIDASTEAQLSDRIEAAAKELARPFKTEVAAVIPAKAIPEVVKPAGPVKVAPKFWWIPGAVGAVSVVGGVVLLGNAIEKYDSLVGKPPPITSLVGANWAGEGKNMQTAGWVFGVGVAAIAASILWLALGSTEFQPQLTVAPGGVSLGLKGQF